MKFCVIGLGRFGYHVATTLAENGMEVLGIEANESIIASIKDQITHAVCLQVSDEPSLRSVGVDEMDTIIVAMGENFAQSILITALLKQRLKIPLVITRAINSIHKEILILIGADQVVLPEKEIGTKLADNLSLPFSVLCRIAKNFSISQVAAPSGFIGKKLSDLDLFNTYKIQCIGIMRDNMVEIIDNDYFIEEHDNLILAGTNKKLETIAQL